MRCKKHLPDLSSTVGVCASCLRERLEALVKAQAQAQTQAQPARVVARAAAVASSNDHHLKKPEPNAPPLNFPRSVSPYVSRRKSDCPADRRRERLFYSTPQVGPAFSSAAFDGRAASSSKRRLGKFWILSNIFRSRSNNKTETSSRESCDPSSSASPPSSSWFSTILPARRHNHDANNGLVDRQQCRQPDRGMSPAITENFGDEFDGHDRSSPSGCSSESSPRRQHQTPVVAPRRSRLGPAGKSVASLAICLSPLVRASPNRNWSHKGLAQELGVGGAHHISSGASLCANRSRKLADFGRVGHNR